MFEALRRRPNKMGKLRQFLWLLWLWWRLFGFYNLSMHLSTWFNGTPWHFNGLLLIHLLCVCGFLIWLLRYAVLWLILIWRIPVWLLVTWDSELFITLPRVLCGHWCDELSLHCTLRRQDLQTLISRSEAGIDGRAHVLASHAAGYIMTYRAASYLMTSRYSM